MIINKILPKITDYHKTLPIIELYPCLQGEGARRGHPSIAIRTTGCTHRCYFGNSGGWCDTWHASIHPQKGQFCFQDIIELCEKHPHIKEIMLTGGAPTMHPEIMNTISHFAYQHHIFVTLETEGSHFVKTDYPLDLISLSPKLSNSIPTLGEITPKGKTVDDQFIAQHNKLRLNIDAMRAMIDYHKDYQFKPICDGSADNIDEITALIDVLSIPKHKVYLMPAGATRQTMIQQYPIIMELALKQGFHFTGRDHIIAFDTKLGV